MLWTVRGFRPGITISRRQAADSAAEILVSRHVNAERLAESKLPQKHNGSILQSSNGRNLNVLDHHASFERRQYLDHPQGELVAKQMYLSRSCSQPGDITGHKNFRRNLRNSLPWDWTWVQEKLHSDADQGRSTRTSTPVEWWQGMNKLWQKYPGINLDCLENDFTLSKKANVIWADVEVERRVLDVSEKEEGGADGKIWQIVLESWWICSSLRRTRRRHEIAEIRCSRPLPAKKAWSEKTEGAIFELEGLLERHPELLRGTEVPQDPLGSVIVYRHDHPKVFDEDEGPDESTGMYEEWRRMNQRSEEG